MKCSLCVFLLLLCIHSFAHAETTTGSFRVTVTVVDACHLTTNQDLAFPDYDGTTSVTQQVGMSVMCTQGTQATVYPISTTTLTNNSGSTVTYSLTDTNGNPLSATQGVTVVGQGRREIPVTKVGHIDQG